MTGLSDVLGAQSTLIALATAVLVLFARLLFKFFQARASINGLPQPPNHFLLGSLMSMGKVMATLPSNIHPHALLINLRRTYNLPGVFYLDTWPFGWPICAILDGEIAQQASVQTVLHKHEATDLAVWPVTGHNSLLSLSGPEHKRWRSIFNPGFSPAHMMTMTDGIVDDCLTFCDFLSEHAASGKTFILEEATTKVTVDIIGRVALDIPMEAQIGQNPFLRAFRSSSSWLLLGNQWNPLKIFNPMRPIMFRYNRRVMDKWLGKVIDTRFDQFKRNLDGNRKRSQPIVDFAFEAYVKDNGFGSRDVVLDTAFKNSLIEHIKVFMFGGYDTSSSAICYIYHELSKHPKILEKVIEEHNTVLGIDTTMAAKKIKEDPYIVNRLPFTIAVIKETLRIWPPASGVRAGRPDFYLHHNGKQYPTDGFMVWIVTQGVHWSPDHWPDPLEFKPERWLSEAGDSRGQAKGTFRPFEQGPRNCIGQELAMLEMKIILALTVRQYDVQAAYEDFDAEHQTKGIQTTPEGERAYQVLFATAKPSNGMPARVRRR